MHLPPPVHGTSLINQSIKASDHINEQFDCEYINSSGSSVTKDVGHLSLRKLTRLLCMYLKVLKTLAVNRFDLVYMTIAVSGSALLKDSLVILLTKALRKKIVIHLHGLGIADERKKHVFMDWYYRFVFKGTSVIHLSNVLLRDVEGLVPVSHQFVVGNGVERSGNKEEPVRNEACPKLLYLSHLIEFKGYFELLQAANILKNRGHKFMLNFVGGWAGNSSAREKFYNFLTKNKLDKFVELSGPQYGQGKEKAFMEASVFILPSHNECFPLCILEAMAHGLPVIATNVGAISEILEDEKTGYIVPAKNPGALADKLETLLNNPELRKQMGAAGREKFLRCYTLSAFEDRLQGVLEQII